MLSRIRRPAYVVLVAALLAGSSAGWAHGASTHAAAASAASGSVATPTEPAFDTYFGTTAHDPYRWLEDPQDPRVADWVKAQGDRSRAHLDAIASRAALKKKLTAMTTGTSPAYGGLTEAGGRLFGYYNDPQFQQPMLVTLGTDADPAGRKTVLDPNVLDKAGLTAIDWFVPSHDGRRVAVSMSHGGSEDGTLHILDAATGQELGDTIPRVQYPTGGGSLTWAADGAGFWYTRYPGEDAPAEDRHFNMQVYFHRLGTEWQKDPLVLGTADGIPRIGEVYLDNRHAPDLLLISVANGDGGEWAHWLVGADRKKVRIAGFPDHVVAATVGADHALYLLSLAGAPRGRILKLAPGVTDLAKAKVIVPESRTAIIPRDSNDPRRPVLAGDRMFLTYIDGGPNEVREFDLDGHARGVLPLPAIASFQDLVALPGGDLLIEVNSYLRPSYHVVRRAATGKVEETRLAVTSPAKFDDAEVVREFAVSKDGTRVPLNIIRRKGTRLDGRNPTLLYGYGGYGFSQEPVFAGPRVRAWLDGGGIWVVANIRGGGEYGERWHDEGRLTRKQNVFDDFAASGEYLVRKRYTDHAHLVLLGGSNGGLLMGAMITQHPGLARAVVAIAGIYDMLRVELDPNGAFNTTEFGTVTERDQFKALFAYSPYHHVQKGAKYPAVLMLTGSNDGRVNPMHSRKIIAALQNATASDEPVLLRISTTSGHGIGTSLNERIDQAADWLAFLYEQVGMKAVD